MAKILVTGALGLIGAWTTQRLLDDGHEVVAVDVREDYTNNPGLKGEVAFFDTDVRDTEGLAGLLGGVRADVLCHIAASMTSPDMDADPDPFASLTVNALGTASAIEACRRAGVGRFTYASSKAVYGVFEGAFGHPTYQLLTEDYPRSTEPWQRAYGAAKVFSEEIGEYFADRFGLSFRSCRFGTIIRPGKRDLGGSAAAQYPFAVRAALEGEPYTQRIRPGAVDDLVYVKDVAQGLARASTTEEVDHLFFNIASGLPRSWHDWRAAIHSHLPDAVVEVLEVEDLPGFRSQGILDISRARNELGYEPAFDLPAMVGDLLDLLDTRVR